MNEPTRLGNLPPLYTLEEAAKYLRMGYETLQTHVRNNNPAFPATRVGKRWLMSEYDLVRCLEGMTLTDPDTEDLLR